VLQIGQTDVLTEETEDGDAEERCEEWQDGVLRADNPAERAIWSSGTGGSDKRVLCVCMKSFAMSSQRDRL
jgi:hypothetical protein